MTHRIWSSQGKEISSLNGDTSVAKCMEAKDILMVLGNPKELGHRTECGDDDREAENGLFTEDLGREVSASEPWRE